MLACVCARSSRQDESSKRVTWPRDLGRASSLQHICLPQVTYFLGLPIGPRLLAILTLGVFAPSLPPREHLLRAAFARRRRSPNVSHGLRKPPGDVLVPPRAGARASGARRPGASHAQPRVVQGSGSGSGSGQPARWRHRWSGGARGGRRYGGGGAGAAIGPASRCQPGAPLPPRDRRPRRRASPIPRARRRRGRWPRGRHPGRGVNKHPT